MSTSFYVRLGEDGEDVFTRLCEECDWSAHPQSSKWAVAVSNSFKIFCRCSSTWTRAWSVNRLWGTSGIKPVAFETFGVEAARRSCEHWPLMWLDEVATASWEWVKSACLSESPRRLSLFHVEGFRLFTKEERSDDRLGDSDIEGRISYPAMSLPKESPCTLTAEEEVRILY